MIVNNIKLAETRYDYSTLMDENEYYANKFKKNKLMRLVVSGDLYCPKKHSKLLSAIQVFSDYFQKIVMLRAVLNDNIYFNKITQQHLREEFSHNEQLRTYRKNKMDIWDPILEATASWFTWKMFTLDNIEKTVLMHLVLEKSGSLFFKKAQTIMAHFGDNSYFITHAQADEEHTMMAKEYLENLPYKTYLEISKAHQQGWDMMESACHRMAVITSN